MEELERELFDAAIEGSLSSLENLLKEDPIILERVVANRFSETPLHVAAMLGHTNFVKEILRINPRLTADIDSLQSTPLHLASAKGHVDVVKVLLSADPRAHLARDRNQLTPLHLAALKSRIEVVNVLLQETLDMALLMVHRGQNILHLCVKHHQLEILKLIIDKFSDTALINAKDADGNSLLHLAVAYKQVEAVEFLVAMPAVDVNAQNLNGMTAVDTLIYSRRDLMDAEIQELLKQAGGVRALEDNIASHPYQDMTNQATPPSFDHHISSTSTQNNNFSNRDNWLDKQRGALMVVASLIATMAFQVGVTPPGGVWQDDNLQGRDNNSTYHVAGFSILARNFPAQFTKIYFYNTASFISSLSIILLLMSGLPMRNRVFVWILMVITWITITFTVVTYGNLILWVTPSVFENTPLLALIGFTLMVCPVLVAAFLIRHTVRLIVKLIKNLRKT